MPFTSELLQSIKKSPNQPLNLFKAKTLYGFGYNDERAEIARRFGCEVKIVNSLCEVAWKDIVFRRVSFTRMPPKSFAGSIIDKFKREMLRLFGDFVRKEIDICCLHEALFLDLGDKTLFTVSTHVAQLYSRHLPKFKVVQVVNEKKEKDLKEIYELGEKLRGRCLDEKTGVTVFANIFVPSFIRTYRILHPNRKIILRFHDIIKTRSKEERGEIVRFVRDLRKSGVVDEVESYDPDDARIIEGKFRPNGVDPDFVLSTDVPYRERLYCFVGTSERGLDKHSRVSDFTEVVDLLKILYPYTSRWNVAKNHDPLTKWVPYEEFARISARSEVCVDLFRLDPNEGFSFRIPEALWLNKKIISNRLCLQKEDFYSPERIFLIGLDPIERLRSFLEKDVEPLPKKILCRYDSRLWWMEGDPSQEVCE